MYLPSLKGLPLLEDTQLIFLIFHAVGNLAGVKRFAENELTERYRF